MSFFSIATVEQNTAVKLKGSSKQNAQSYLRTGALKQNKQLTAEIKITMLETGEQD